MTSDLKKKFEELIEPIFVEHKKSSLNIKWMHWQKKLSSFDCPQFLLDRYSPLYNGVYIDIQNFQGRIPHSKIGLSETMVRYTFRLMLFRDQSDFILECAEWRPSMGKLDNAKVIFRDEFFAGKNMFCNLLKMSLKTYIPVESSLWHQTSQVHSET
jgi:hypothetical protein